MEDQQTFTDHLASGEPPVASFKIGTAYTRKDIFDALGLEADPTGGNWFTGYNRHGDDWFIFANVGVPGRTGHDYHNYWAGDGLHWRGKTGSRLFQPAIQSMLRPRGKVHVFTRDDDRSAFVYHGEATAGSYEDTEPVTIVWQFTHALRRPPELLPEEITTPQDYLEGATRTVTVNVYERDPEARRACIEHYGPRCVACGFDFGLFYGELGEGFIHVHHLKPLSEVGREYRVDPVADLRPVCPNCHAMVHREDPPISIERLREMIAEARRRVGQAR
jgi:5-methylcytosine-specific restriction enzyme A